MKKLLLLLFVFPAAFGQAPIVDWISTGGGDYSDGVTAMARDTNGNLYTAGFYNNAAQFGSVILPEGSFSIFLAKYDEAGALVWIKSFQNNSNLFVNTLEVDSQGGILIGGYHYFDVDLDPSEGEFMLTTGGSGYVAKYDSNGNFLWANETQSQNSDVNDIAIDENGTIYAIGRFFSTVDLNSGEGNAIITGGPDSNMFLVAYNPDGDYVWGFGVGTDIGPASGRSLKYDNGFLYLTGEFAGTADFDPSAAEAMRQSENRAFYIAKYSTTGSFYWANIMEESEAWNWISGESIATDAAGNIYVSGYFVEGFDADPSGNTAPVMGGILYSNGFLAKYDANGAYQWAKAFTSWDDSIDPMYLSVDPNGRIAVSGMVNETISFGTTSGESQDFTGHSDIFVAIYSTDGVLQTATLIGSEGDGFKQMRDDYVGGLLLTENDLFLGGRFTTTTNFSFPGQNAFELTIPEYQSEAFLARYSATTLGVKEENPAVASVYPNPTSDKIHLKNIISELQLFDLSGRLLGSFPENTSEIDLTGLSSATYILKSENLSVKILKK